MSRGESGYPPWPCPLVPTSLLISIQRGFQANVCKKTSCFFPSPWHLCAWNNDRDFSSDAICCWVRHCFYIYRQMLCDSVNTVDFLMSHFWGSQRGHSKRMLPPWWCYQVSFYLSNGIPIKKGGFKLGRNFVVDHFIDKNRNDKTKCNTNLTVHVVCNTWTTIYCQWIFWLMSFWM